MADRNIEQSVNEKIEIPEILESVLIYLVNEAKSKAESGEDIIPFTGLAVKETLFVEEHEGAVPEQCYELAYHTVQNACGAEAYGFCYDGYIDTDTGTVDAIIAEGGIPASPSGFAIALPYAEKEDGIYEFDKQPILLGNAPNFMSELLDPSAYSQEEIDEVCAHLDENIEEEITESSELVENEPEDSEN